MAFIGSLFPTTGGLFGPSSGGLFGGGNSGGFSPPPILGVSENILSASFNVDLLESGLRAINGTTTFGSALTGGFGPAAITDLEIPESTRSLSAQASEAAGPEPFIDLSDPAFDPFSGNVDQTTSFALFRALVRLQTIAEFAGQEDTTDATRARLNESFLQGLGEVRSFLPTAQTNLLTFFEGGRTSDADAEVRIDDAPSDFQGQFIFSSRDEPIAGLTGDEVFTVNIARPTGDPDAVTIDLSGITGDLSLDNVVDFINAQIEAVPLFDSEGQQVFDEEGNPVSNSQTRFVVNQDVGGTGQFGIFINATLTETVTLSAASDEPSLFVASNVEQTTTDLPDRVQVSEFENLSGTIAQDDVFQFAGTDISGTEFQELIDEANIDTEDTLSAGVAALRDQFRSDAIVDVLGEDADTLTAGTASLTGNDEIPITDVVSTERAQAATTAQNIATDSEGNIVVVGASEGSFGDQLNVAETQDVFITKFDRLGNVIFSRLLGASDDASGFAVAVDSEDNIVVTGQTNSPLVETDTLDGSDAFVAKFSSSGDPVFRFQLDTIGTTSGLAVTTDASNNIIVAGSTTSSISGAGAFQGVTDGFVLTLDGTTGSQTGQSLFGTSGRDAVQAVAVASDGNILIASEEGSNAVVRRVDATDLSNTLSTLDLGTIGSGEITGIAVEGNQIVVSGTTTAGPPSPAGATVNGTANGALDGFVVGLDDTGGTLNAVFSTSIGTAAVDSINDVEISGGSVFVAGTTASTLTGETAIGSSDGFVARINGTTGAIEDTQQFGQAFTRLSVAGAAFSSQGDSVLDVLGLPAGTVNRDQSVTITAQTSARVGDFFTIEIAGVQTRIEVNSEGDDFSDIARQINIAGLSARVGEVVDASVRSSSSGDVLEINTVPGGVPITFIPGDGGKDLLSRLGIPSGTILPADQLFGDADLGSRELGGTFALDIDLDFDILTQESALFTLGRIQDAVETTQRAFRSLFPSPLADLLDNPTPTGTASPATLARIANLTDGLVRLQAAGLGTGGLSLTL